MIRSLEDLDPLERISLIDMSYSRINSYSMCPAKYFYTYVTKESRVFSAPAALGNIVHDVLEDHVGEEKELDLDTLIASFNEHRPEHDPETLIDEELVEAAHVMMAEFIDRHEGEDFAILSKEQGFSVVLGSTLITGYIDRVDQITEDIVHIIDYKTGKFEETKVQNNPQLGIYVLAISHLYPQFSTFKAELYYLRSGRRKTHTFTREDLPRLEEQALEYVNEIIEDKYFHNTTNARICMFCEHASSGACRTGVQRRKNPPFRRKKKSQSLIGP